MKQSNVIKGTLAVVALVAALVVGVAVHMHSVGSPTAGHSTQNTAKTATETTAKTAESITADYPGYSSAEEGVKAAGLVVTGVPLDSRERILYPEIDFTSGTPETNPQYGLTEDDIDMDALGEQLRTRKEQLVAQFETAGLPTPKTHSMKGAPVDHVGMA